MSRAATPLAIYLEYEHEASIERNRYIYQMLLSNPDAVKDSPWLEDYRRMLADFDRWRDRISQLYLWSWPQWAATLPDAEAIQRGRAQVLKLLMGEDAGRRGEAYWRELLSRLNLGSGELARVKSEQGRFLEKFLRDEYPEMRRRSYPALSKLFLKQALSVRNPTKIFRFLDTAENYAELMTDGPEKRALLEMIEAAKWRKEAR
ncbi:MAG: hypothetical protein HY921_07175 [Elusimicrobia bacterium]|nr:hypothetical protein [Elusimicrobiota bacterium]